MSNRLLPLAAFVAWSLAIFAREADNAKPVPPLPEAVRAAWEKAGATVGWMEANPDGWITFRIAGGDGKPGEVPAFSFRKWQPGLVGKLPQPEQAFGLDLYNVQVADAGLKELAVLKQLQVLDLEEPRSGTRT